MSSLEIDIPRKARDVLLPTHTASGHRTRWRVLYGGRDGAKSHSIGRVLLARGRAKRERILCVREVQNSIKDSVHKLLSDLIETLGLSGFYDVYQTAIVGKNGTEFLFQGLSTETRDSLKSKEGTTICWVEEAQTISKASLDILEPTIRAEDSEIVLSFNPMLDTDEVYKRFVTNPPADALVGKIGWEDNPWRSAVLDVAREKMQREAPEDFEHIYGGKPRTTVEGAIFHREIVAALETKRVRSVPYDPMLKVHTIWDLGWNDKTSIIGVQRVASEVRIVHYWEESFLRLDEWVAELEKTKYRWGKDWLPHDGGAQQQNAGGKSTYDILKALGRTPVVCKAKDYPGATDPEARITAARMMFPRVYFEETKAAQLFERLKRYRRRINQTTLQPEGPLHDDASHGSDAFGLLAIVVDKLSNDDGWFDKKIEYDSRGVV